MLEDKDMTDESVVETPPFRDEDGTVRAEFVERVGQAVAAGQADDLRALVGDLHESDLGDLIEALSPESRAPLVQQLGRDFDFSALTEVDDTIREEILEELPNEAVAEGMRNLESDDAVYILEDMPKEDQDEILQALPLQERVKLARSLLFPENSAGRRMQMDFVAVPPTWNVGQTIDYLRENAELPERFYDLYVVDHDDRLRGSVPLDQLLRSKRPVGIADLVHDEIYRVHGNDDQEEVARLFERYNLASAPVVTEDDRLVGIITFDDVVDIIEAEADEDMKALGGIRGEEELSDTVLYTVRSRFPWLFINLLAALMSGYVISRFSDSLEKMVALAVLMPIVASMGGNAGTQTMTVTVRAIATRDLGRANAWRVARRELMVGLLNGCALATILGIIAATWFNIVDLGVVIAMALVTVFAIAALGGLGIPLLLSRLGVDPAVSSGPFVTTTTDVIGFFLFLGIATLWFGLR
ncbi:MAG TPA: magnesium transporter [Xanthobacteraceae bacterium]|nr:magnesium transporter [Xanthobacteraceae bacterium]